MGRGLEIKRWWFSVEPNDGWGWCEHVVRGFGCQSWVCDEDEGWVGFGFGIEFRGGRDWGFGHGKVWFKELVCVWVLTGWHWG